MKQSAGILLYRLKNNELEVFLVHPGGPFFAKKDGGVWSIPKGEFSDEEDPPEAAKREFQEETGVVISGQLIVLSPVRQKGGKTIHAWAAVGDLDPGQVKSNTFEMEWPPRSGRKQSFPEIDRGEWFTVPVAKEKMNQAQVALLDELMSKLKTPDREISPML